MARRFFLLLGLMVLASQLGAVEIRLLDSVRIAGPEITLKDIAVPGKPLQWGDLVIARFEGEELERTIRYTEVLHAIRQASDRPFFLIGSSVLVKRVSTLLRREEMSSFIRRELARQRRGAFLDFDPEILPLLREFAGQGVAMRLETGRAPTSGPWQGRLVFVREGSELAGIELKGRLRFPGRVLVAARDCYGGRFLKPDEMRFEPVDDVGDPATLLTVAMIKGRRLLSDIKEGTRLTEELFEKPLAVRRGMRVDVVWRRNGVAIEVPAEALEDGRTGDLIRLRNSHTAREFRALIREESGKVYVDG